MLAAHQHRNSCLHCRAVPRLSHPWCQRCSLCPLLLRHQQAAGVGLCLCLGPQTPGMLLCTVGGRERRQSGGVGWRRRRQSAGGQWAAGDRPVWVLQWVIGTHRRGAAGRPRQRPLTARWRPARREARPGCYSAAPHAGRAWWQAWSCPKANSEQPSSSAERPGPWEGAAGTCTVHKCEQKAMASWFWRGLDDLAKCRCGKCTDGIDHGILRDA